MIDEAMDGTSLVPDWVLFEGGDSTDIYLLYLFFWGGGGKLNDFLQYITISINRARYFMSDVIIITSTEFFFIQIYTIQNGGIFDNFPKKIYLYKLQVYQL